MPRLELRPNCELCDRDLPATSPDARICSYECTYCADCADTVLKGVCPTCGGNFAPRPIRPHREHRPGSGLGLINNPPSTKREHSPWTEQEIMELVQRLHTVLPKDR